MKKETHTKELEERARREPDAVLRVWKLDGRKWINRIAEAELTRRQPSA